jgi:hypothetical protein
MWSVKNSSVKMNPHLERVATQIANELDFNIVVTSAIRTARQQATAMRNKLIRGEDLTKIYKDNDMARDITAIYQRQGSLDEIEQYIENYTKQGGVISRHLTGEALDLRTLPSWGYTQEDVDAMIRAVKRLGYFALLESDHLHVTARNPKKKFASNWLILAVAIGLIYAI